MTFSAVVTFRVCFRYSLRKPILAQVATFAFTLVAIWLTWSTSSSLKWAQFLPHSSVILVAKASLILIIGTAGFIFGSSDFSLKRRVLMTLALSSAAILAISSPIIRPLFQPLQLSVDSRWQGEVCLQSNEASCAPAAAATLLSQYGIETSERLMAESCLSSEGGTLTLGAFRGIYRATNGGNLTPRALVCGPKNCSREHLSARLPMLTLVDFEEQLAKSDVPQPKKSSPPRLRRMLGSAEGSVGLGLGQISLGGEGQHAVVLLELLDDGQWLVADPAVGTIRWSDQYFRDVWIGEGIYLVSK